MKSRGRILVLGLLAVGLAAAIAAVWQQHRQSRRALAYWGVEVVELISKAERVKLMRLKDLGPGSATGELLDSEHGGLPAIDLGHAPGLVHFRHSLLEDINFEWDRRPNVAADEWDYAVRFSDGEREATILFDLDGASVWKKGSALPAVGVTKRMASGFATFFEEQQSSVSNGTNAAAVSGHAAPADDAGGGAHGAR